MSDFVSNIDDRRNYLGMKQRLGLPLTEAEQQELEQTRDLRITPTNGPVYIEAQPMSVSDWKAIVQRERAEGGWIQRADGMTDKP